MLSHIYLPFALGSNIIKYVWTIYMNVHSQSGKLVQKTQFVNLTFSQMTFREISLSHTGKLNKIGNKNRISILKNQDFSIRMRILKKWV